MDEAMSVSVADMVISDLTTMYGNEPTFNSGKIAVIVNKVIEEVIRARKYRDRGYSDERIEIDLVNYKSQIYNISEYDFTHIGGAWETSHSENSISRTWIERNKLFFFFLPLEKRGLYKIVRDTYCYAVVLQGVPCKRWRATEH